MKKFKMVLAKKCAWCMHWLDFPNKEYTDAMIDGKEDSVDCCCYPDMLRDQIEEYERLLTGDPDCKNFKSCLRDLKSALIQQDLMNAWLNSRQKGSPFGKC